MILVLCVLRFYISLYLVRVVLCPRIHFTCNFLLLFSITIKHYFFHIPERLSASMEIRSSGKTMNLNNECTKSICLCIRIMVSIESLHYIPANTLFAYVLCVMLNVQEINCQDYHVSDGEKY